MLAPLVVNSTSDASGPFNTTDSEVTLREAVFVANALPDIDTIVFDPNFFNIPREILLTQGELNITESVTITGTGRDNLTIDGNNQSRIFSISTVDVTIQDLKLWQGSASSGAGIHTSGNLTLDTVRVADNTATGNGGGLSTTGDSLTITDSIFENNTADESEGFGGAIRATVDNLTISGSEFRSNLAFNGGAIDATINAGMSDDPWVITTSTFEDNVGKGNGGAIQLKYSAIASGTISQSHFERNEAGALFGGSGGAIHVFDSQSSGGALLIDDVVITKNKATQSGGGIAIFTGSVGSENGLIVIQDSVISYNEVGETPPMSNGTTGGGGIMASVFNQRILIDRSSIHHNRALPDINGSDGSVGSEGGGLRLVGVSDTGGRLFEIVNTTISKTVRTLVEGSLLSPRNSRRSGIARSPKIVLELIVNHQGKPVME